MGLFKNIFKKKKPEKVAEPSVGITSNHDFWAWFQTKEKEFFDVVKTQNEIEENFFDVISPKLSELREGYWFVAGMYNDQTAELILTADGTIKNIPFVEDLVADAPEIKGWRITALKPPMDISNVAISMGDLRFDKDNLTFYSNDDSQFPDEVDITVVHQDLNEENRDGVVRGVYIFLDNFLGELESATNIDSLQVIGPEAADKELVPIAKLKDFLVWREKEFVEKYDDTRYENEEDSYGTLEAELENGLPWFAVVNSSLLNWENKASHPWIVAVEIAYDGADNNGLPDQETFDLMNDLEDAANLELTNENGCLNVGRKTANNMRVCYFACKEFRLPAKVLSRVTEHYKDRLDVDFVIYKDKYWQSMDQFRVDY